MSKTASINASNSFGIKFKVTSLILILSLTSLIGICIVTYNDLRFAYNITKNYEGALANNYFSKFDGFLHSLQASSGISQNFGELYYKLRNRLDRQELAKSMEEEYHTAFAREPNLLGGGAFYEPHAFYPDIYEFHYFASKELTASGIPSEQNVRWLGNEWKWDVDTYEQGWYKIVLPKGWNRATPREKRHYWSELYIDTSVDALMVTVSLPIYSPEKTIVGVSTVDVSLSTLQKMILSFPLPTSSAQIVGFSVINNATFAISGSDKFDIVPYPKDSWLNKLKELKTGQTISDNITIGKEEYLLLAHVHESGIGLGMLIPKEEQNATLDDLQKSNFITITIIVIIMVLIIIFVFFAISKWIIKPIHRTFKVLETFAKGDLTQNIKVSGSDELSKMIGIIGDTQESFKNIIKAIGNKADIQHDDSQNLSSIAAELSNFANGTVAKSTEITRAMEQMAVNIKTMASDAEKASINANDVASTAEQMSVNMSTVATTVEKMSASISKIATNTGEMREVAKEATTKATHATGVMNELGNAAKEIGQVTDVIKKIADKTNLLALNATIEAASAGEAGKGFAVVASEIKELANQSSHSADDIAHRIEHIQTGTNNAVTVINDVSDIIVKINNSVESISGHVEQQTKASNEIANNVSQANTGAKRVASAIGDVAKGAENVSRNASDVANGATDVSGNVGNMNQLAQESSHGATQVNQSAGNLAEIAKELKQTIAQFKV